MTTRKPTTETETEPSNTDAETPNSDATPPETVPPAVSDAANTVVQAAVDATVGVLGPTGTPVDGTITIVGDATELGEHLADLKALGNANPDVNVVAVQSAHGTWTWTARAAVDDRKLAVGGPHHAARLVENLKLLLSGSTIALHTTGSDTVHQLS